MVKSTCGRDHSTRDRAITQWVEPEHMVRKGWRQQKRWSQKKEEHPIGGYGHSQGQNHQREESNGAQKTGAKVE